MSTKHTARSTGTVRASGDNATTNGTELTTVRTPPPVEHRPPGPTTHDVQPPVRHGRPPEPKRGR
jgi:hypothetical protein